MAIQKERRATPRRPAPTPGTPKSDRPLERSATPQREMPKRPAEAAPEKPSEVPSPEDLRRRIEMNAYFKAKARGFHPGYELQDWLDAEREMKPK
jgi:hypothetical protein